MQAEPLRLGLFFGDSDADFELCRRAFCDEHGEFFRTAGIVERSQCVVVAMTILAVAHVDRPPAVLNEHEVEEEPSGSSVSVGKRVNGFKASMKERRSFDRVQRLGLGTIRPVDKFLDFEGNLSKIRWLGIGSESANIVASESAAKLRKGAEQYERVKRFNEVDVECAILLDKIENGIKASGKTSCGINVTQRNAIGHRHCLFENNHGFSQRQR